MKSIRYLLSGWAALTVALAVGIPEPAEAADNDLQLNRLATFETSSTTGDCGNRACGRANPNPAQFEALVSQFGQVVAPNFASPAETLGEAGFSVQLIPSIATIPSEQEHWKALEGGRQASERPGVLFTPELLVRKGLPFSFEIAGSMSHVAGSDMFTVGSQLKWALNEGFYIFPDVAVRGVVNTLVGSKDLEMLTTGGDISISKAFPIGGVMTLAPYAGYQRFYSIGWSRLLNVVPHDPRSPQSDPDGNEAFNPEFVFDSHTAASDRFFIGSRLNVWIVSLMLEGTFDLRGDVFKGMASVGLNF